MAKPKKDETRTKAQQLEDLPVSRKEADEVKGGLNFTRKGETQQDFH